MITNNPTPEFTVPDAPTLLEARALVKEGIKSNPEQATQIFACLGAVKKAKDDSYEAYTALCYQLDVEPCDEDQWATHDKAVFKPLIIASLTKNLPFAKLSNADIEALLDAVDARSKQSVVNASTKIMLKALGASEAQTSEWAKLANAAVAFL